MVIVQLTWVISPPSVPYRGDKDMLIPPVALEITVGTKTRHVKLAPQLGDLKPRNQTLCGDDSPYPRSRADVSQLTFYEGGAGGYIARHTGDALVVLSWEEGEICTDSHGNDTSCPMKKKQVFKMAVPAKAKFTEAIVEVDEKGVRHPFDCSR